MAQKTLQNDKGRTGQSNQVAEHQTPIPTTNLLVPAILDRIFFCITLKSSPIIKFYTDFSSTESLLKRNKPYRKNAIPKRRYGIQRTKRKKVHAPYSETFAKPRSTSSISSSISCNSCMPFGPFIFICNGIKIFSLKCFFFSSGN